MSYYALRVVPIEINNNNIKIFTYTEVLEIGGGTTENINRKVIVVLGWCIQSGVVRIKERNPLRKCFITMIFKISATFGTYNYTLN